MPLLKTAAITAATALGAYALGLVFGPSLETRTEIAASPQTVWKHLTDSAAYPDWNPLIRQMSGDLSEGGQIAVTIGLGDRTPMTFTPKLLAVDAARELRWIGRLGFRGVFDGEHYFQLEETAQGTTVLRHGESFRGLLAFPLFALIGKDTRTGFEAMNAALKARAEGRT